MQHRHKPSQSSSFAVLGDNDIQVGVFLEVIDGDDLFVLVRSWFGKRCVQALPVQVVSAQEGFRARLFTDPILLQSIDIVQTDRVSAGILKLTQVPA